MLLAALVAVVAVAAQCSGRAIELELKPRKRDISPNEEMERIIQRYSQRPSENHTDTNSIAFRRPEKDNVQKMKRSPEVTLTNYNKDTQYFVEVDIGTPPTRYELTLDSGSGDMVVASAPCNGCLDQTPLFLPFLSSTALVSSHPFQVLYGSGETQGYLVKDTVQLAGRTIENHIFGAGTEFQGLLNSSASGILGLGWRKLTSQGTMPLVEQLWRNGELDDNMVSIAFASYRQDEPASTSTNDGKLRPGGRLTLGGFDDSVQRGDVNWINITHQDSPTFWNIPLKAVLVGGKSIDVSARAVSIDTGSTLIAGPSSFVSKLYSEIPGSQTCGDNLYCYPCDTDKTIAFNFNDVIYGISPQDFSNGKKKGDGNLCYGAFFALPGEASTMTEWVIGLTFLKNVVTSFRFDPPSVGFAAFQPGVTQGLEDDDAALESNATTLERYDQGQLGASNRLGISMWGMVLGVLSAVFLAT